MNKLDFISSRSDKRELQLITNSKSVIILVEGKNDKFFYNKYICKNKKTKVQIEVKECQGIISLAKIWKQKVILNNEKNFYAIIDRDSYKYRSSDKNYENLKHNRIYKTDGYCLENYFFTEENLANTLLSNKKFLQFSDNEEYNKNEYCKELINLLNDYLNQYSESSNFILENTYYKRSKVSYIKLNKTGDFYFIQINDNPSSLKYFDNIPNNFNSMHGKDLLLGFRLILKELDNKYKNIMMNKMSSDDISNNPLILLELIDKIKISSLDKFLKKIKIK